MTTEITIIVLLTLNLIAVTLLGMFLVDTLTIIRDTLTRGNTYLLEARQELRDYFGDGCDFDLCDFDDDDDDFADERERARWN